MGKRIKSLILITNDDGVLSPGLAAAACAASEYGDLLIAAPNRQHTSMARSFPSYKDSGVIDEIEIIVCGKPHTAYAVHGSPAYAVTHACMELADRPIDLCISGINYGENIGTSVTCSGTVGAALEANINGIPSLAFSIEATIENQYKEGEKLADLDFTVSERVIKYFIEKTLREGLPRDTALLNINIPAEAQTTTPYVVTKQSRQEYYGFVHPGPRDFLKPFMFENTIDVNMSILERDSDIYCLAVKKHISVTPISWNMTARDEVWKPGDIL